MVGEGREGRARVVVSVDLTDAAGRNGKARDGASTDTRDAFGSGTHRRWRAETPLRRRLGRLCTPGATRGPTRTPSRRSPRHPSAVWHAPAEISYPRPPFGTTRRGTVRRLETRAPPDSMDAPTDRGRCRMLRARALVQSDYRGADPRATKSFESKSAQGEPNGPRDDLDGFFTSTQRRRRVGAVRCRERCHRGGFPPLRYCSARRQRAPPSRPPWRPIARPSSSPSSATPWSTSPSVRRHAFARIGPRVPASSLSRRERLRLDVSARARRLRPLFPRAHPPSHSSHPSQALWTRCPSPARTSRWTR